MIRDSKFQSSFTKFLFPVLLGVLVLVILPSDAAAATDFKPSQIKFDVSTYYSTYRAVKGEKLTIKTKFSLASDSVQVSIKKGNQDTDSINSNKIDGFYAAAVGKGVASTCGLTSCGFESETAKVTALPSGDLDLDIQTNNSGDRELWIFPVADLASQVDAPFTTNPLTVKIEIYNTAADLGTKPRTEGAAQTVKTSAVDQLTVISPDKIIFDLTTDGTVYNTYSGGPRIKIATKVSLASGSAQITINDKLASSIVGISSSKFISGFYAATAGKGVKATCDSFRCNFEEELKPHPAALPLQGNIELDTGDAQKYPVGIDRGILVFPVIDVVANADAPFTNKSAEVTIHVYENKDTFDKAAAAAGVTPDKFFVTGDQGGTTTSASGSGSDNGLGGTVISIINIILGAVIAILRWFVWILGTYIFVPLLETTLSIHASDITSPIVVGWEFVRDVVNMFFILILIIIGFATMLKIESYNYKKLLVNLIMMAILVNFSLVIGRIIIQLMDVAQFNFLSDTDGVTGVKYLFTKLTTSQIPGITDGFFATGTAGALATTMSILFQFILELGVILAFGAMAVFMLIRTVALYILLVLSPFAYALNIIPATVSLAKKWWSNFLKYALFAPIMAFFLRLTANLYDGAFKVIPDSSILAPTAAQTASDFHTYLNQLGGTTGNITFKASLQLVIIYVVILAFMWAALLVTKNMGIAGAGAIIGFAQRGFKGGGMLAPIGFLGKRGFGYAGRKWNEFTANKIRGEKRSFGRNLAFALLNPVAAVKGWEARSKELKETARGKAQATGLEAVEQTLTRGKKVIPRVLAHEKHEEDEFVKIYQGMTREQQIATANHLVGMKGEEGARMKRALMKVVMSNGYVDDITTDAGAVVAKMRTTKGWDEEEHTYKDKQGNTKIKYNDDTRRMMYKAFMGDDQSALRLIAEDGSKYGKETNHWEYLKDVWFNTGSGQYEMRPTKENDPNNGSTYAASELAKQDSRTQARVAWHALMDIDKDGVIDKNLFRTASSAIYENPTFMQERTAGKLLIGEREMTNIQKAEFDNSGALEIDKASFDRINQMNEISPEAVAAMFQRFTKQGTDANSIKERIKNGFSVKLEGETEYHHIGSERKKAELERESNVNHQIANEAVESGAVTEGQGKQNVEKSLQVVDRAGDFPYGEAIIAKLDEIVNTRTSAINLSSNYINKQAKVRSNAIDYGVILETETDRDVRAKLSNEQLAHLAKALQDGVQRGLVNMSKIQPSETGGRKSELKIAIKDELGKIGEKVGIADLPNKFNTDRFVEKTFVALNTNYEPPPAPPSPLGAKPKEEKK